jgi:DNA polymerase III sliding clamp (beta) subunit (PCNA family)
MEAIIQAKKLKEQVGALQGIFDRKATIPVLGKIKIEAGTSGGLVMTATDLDVSLTVEQETDILQPWFDLSERQKTWAADQQSAERTRAFQARLERRKS